MTNHEILIKLLPRKHIFNSKTNYVLCLSCSSRLVLKLPRSLLCISNSKGKEFPSICLVPIALSF